MPKEMATPPALAAKQRFKNGEGKMPNENESPEKADPNSEKPMEDIDEEPMALLHANLHPDEMLPSSGWVLVPVIGTIQSDGKLVLKDGWKDFGRFDVDQERQPDSPRIPGQDDPGR